MRGASVAKRESTLVPESWAELCSCRCEFSHSLNSRCSSSATHSKSAVDSVQGDRYAQSVGKKLKQNKTSEVQRIPFYYNHPTPHAHITKYTNTLVGLMGLRQTCG